MVYNQNHYHINLRNKMLHMHTSSWTRVQACTHAHTRMYILYSCILFFLWIAWKEQNVCVIISSVLNLVGPMCCEVARLISVDSQGLTGSLTN